MGTGQQYNRSCLLHGQQICSVALHLGHDLLSLQAASLTLVPQYIYSEYSMKSSCHVDFDDGHKPGATETQTMLAVHADKESRKFVSMFDDLLNVEWRQRVYQYSLIKKKPWGKGTVKRTRSNYQRVIRSLIHPSARDLFKLFLGVYIPTSDIFDPLISEDILWDVEPERAIALAATKELFFKRGKGLIRGDIDRIAGKIIHPHFITLPLDMSNLTL